MKKSTIVEIKNSPLTYISYLKSQLSTIVEIKNSPLTLYPGVRHESNLQ